MKGQKDLRITPRRHTNDVLRHRLLKKNYHTVARRQEKDFVVRNVFIKLLKTSTHINLSTSIMSNSST